MERLSRYVAIARGDRKETIVIYEKNTRLSEAFYTPLQGLEVCLRNALHLELATLLGADWFENKQAIFEHPATEMIKNAKESLRVDGKQIVAGRLIPELNFGFWASILGPRYDTSLWAPALRRAFPRRPKGMERKGILKAINKIRRLRNRVAHHEPIIHRDLGQDHRLIVDIISWCCSDTAVWVSSQSRFPEIAKAP